MLSKTLSMGQAEPSSDFGHVIYDEDLSKFASNTRVVPDLPSWTPRRTLGDDEDSTASDPKADELSITKSTDSATERLGEVLTNAQPAAKSIMTAGQTLKSSSDAKPSKAKRATFDGVLIALKGPPRHKKYSSQTRSRPVPAANTQVLSLVDALARTFDANRHTEDPFPRRFRTGLHQRDDASTAPQTDAETTEAEDEQLQLNARLAYTSLKKRHTRAKVANASETNSEDATPFLQDIAPLERPVKRRKPISYELNPALIDAALGTVQAPISWNARLNIIGDENSVSPAQTVHVPSADVRMVVDEGVHTAGSPGKGSSLPSTPAANEWRTPTWGDPKRAVLESYLSRGSQFRQRLNAIFGANAIVRTDRIARPRPVSSAPYTKTMLYALRN